LSDKTPQLTNMQLSFTNRYTGQNKDNNITINKKQTLRCEKQMLLLGSCSFTTVLRKESLRQTSEGPWMNCA